MQALFRPPHLILPPLVVRLRGQREGAKHVACALFPPAPGQYPSPIHLLSRLRRACYSLTLGLAHIEVQSLSGSLHRHFLIFLPSAARLRYVHGTHIGSPPELLHFSFACGTPACGFSSLSDQQHHSAPTLRFFYLSLSQNPSTLVLLRQRL
ncbi:hypothetical protein AURDEDRAFT_167807 [Auricularia subglabra TFB-10046 SS5]|nr:hypothetical protein AURDEDRAFT_167807 [Auricularia subglabra TFB-10046 SS5]